MIYLSAVFFLVKYAILTSKADRKTHVLNILLAIPYVYAFSQVANLSVKSVEMLADMYKLFGSASLVIWSAYYFIDVISSLFVGSYFKSIHHKNSVFYSLELSLVTAAITFLVIHLPLLIFFVGIRLGLLNISI